MKKKGLYIAAAVLFVFVITFSLYFVGGSKKSKTYIGIDGQIVTVRGDFSKNSNLNSPDGLPKVGTVIEGENGKDEVVFAVNEDGSYITIPVEDYQRNETVE